MPAIVSKTSLRAEDMPSIGGARPESISGRRSPFMLSNVASTLAVISSLDMLSGKYIGPKPGTLTRATITNYSELLLLPSRLPPTY